MAEQREEPYYDKIKHGRMRAWVYFTGKGGRPAYEVECFRWYRPSKQARWQKIYRYNHERDFHDVARCLEEADRWIGKQEGRDAPESKQVGFSLAEVAAILHLLGSVRRLDTASPALWEFEKRVRSSLGEFGAEEITEAVAEHEKSERFGNDLGRAATHEEKHITGVGRSWHSASQRGYSSLRNPRIPDMGGYS